MPTAPIAIPKTVIPTWTVLMKTHRACPSGASAAAPRGCRPRRAPAGVTARADERVLPGDEQGIAQHEQENQEDPEEVAHAPLSGARGLGGWSSSNVL